MRDLNMPAVRAGLKATRELEARFAVAFEMDHAICPDGYGTRGLWESYNEQSDEILGRVAVRFGMTAEGLRHEIQHAAHEEQYRFFNRSN